MSSACLRCLLAPLVGAAALGVAIPKCGPAALAEPADPPAAPSPAAIRIYRASCLECHDTDGRGEIARDVMREIPNFTDAAWQSSRTDAELGHSILEGKGKSMRPMRNKLGSVGVSQMVALVRAFRGGKQIVNDNEEHPAGLQPAAGPTPAPGPRSPSAEPAPPSPMDLSLREASRTFLRTCARCHASDGRGNEMRDSLPALPDFTVHAWQESRHDAQLLFSVLDGKGTGMPPFREKVSREQARELVAFIRSLDPSRTRATRAPADDFEARFQQLLGEFQDLRRRSRALSADDAAPTGDAHTPPQPSTPPPSTSRPSS